VNAKCPPLAWVALGLLVALVATNAVFLILLRTGGPLIGLVFYVALLIVVWRRRRPDWRPVMVGGLVGFAVHIVEVVVGGWTAYPLLVALNLILPLALAPVAWLAGREVVDAHPDR
jgi:4-hydroxybenzoate polyprenyltransferase